MKRWLPWMFGLACAGLILPAVFRDSLMGAPGDRAEAAKKEDQVAAAQPAGKPQAPAPVALQADGAGSQPPAGKVIYTFADEDKMREFMKLWQQRQGIVLRMTVLQAYWNQEHEALAKLNNQLATDYHLDTTKSYSFDDQRRALIEHEAPPAAQSANQPAPQPASP